MDITIHLIDPLSQAIIRFLAHRQQCTHSQVVGYLIVAAVNEQREQDQELHALMCEFEND